MNNNVPNQPQAQQPEERSTICDFQLYAEFLAEKQQLDAKKSSDERSKNNMLKKAAQLKAISVLLRDYEGESLSASLATIEQFRKEWEDSGELNNPSLPDEELDRYDHLVATHEFMVQHGGTLLRERSDFREWKRKKMEVRPSEPATTRHTEKGEIERLEQQNVLEMILESGGIRVSTSILQSDSPTSTGSGFNILDHRFLMARSQNSGAMMQMEMQFYTGTENRSLRADEIMRNLMRKNNVHEVIDIRPVTKMEEIKIVEPATKGFMGMGGKPETVRYEKTGRQIPSRHAELVQGGKQEPAWRITYYVDDPEWKDYSGRRGQYLQVEIVLPEAIMKKAGTLIDADPQFIRRIVEHVMKEKILSDASRWSANQPDENSLRPRYENWPNSRIYIQKENDPKGWNEQSARRV